MSQISSRRLASRFETYSPNRVKTKCQISRKLTNSTKFPSFTRISKNSAKLKLPTRRYWGRVDTTKATAIKTRSNSLTPLVNTLRLICIGDPSNSRTEFFANPGGRMLQLRGSHGLTPAQNRVLNLTTTTTTTLVNICVHGFAL